jgi:hypothetical protein
MNPFDIRRQALKWLFAAIRPWLSQGQTSALEFPRGNDVPWKTVGDLAYFHNLEPILYWVVSNNESQTDTPEWLKQKWEQAYFGNFLKNKEYFDVLKALLCICEKEGISVIVLKGPALIGRIYKDSGLRTLSDLDILCAKADLAKLSEVAFQLGCTPMEPGNGPSSTHHVAFQGAGPPGPGTILEFHFMPYELIQNHDRFMQLAWDRREWIEVDDVHCPVLCLEMELLFNVAHMVQHQFDVPLKHYLDIAGLLVLCREQLNWDEIGTLLRDFGLENVFALTIGFISGMMRLPPISQTSRFKDENSAQQEFNASLQDLLALLDETRLLDVRGVIWSFRIAVQNRKGLGNKVAYVVNVLFPFLGGLGTYRGIGSLRDVFRYFLRHLLFYGRRLFLTITHPSKELVSNKQHSLALERAAAKDRITRQLLSIASSPNPTRPEGT